MLPIIQTFAPAAIALVTSPEYLIPPSAIIGIPYLLASLAAIHDCCDHAVHNTSNYTGGTDESQVDSDLNCIYTINRSSLGSGSCGSVFPAITWLRICGLDLSAFSTEDILRMTMSRINNDDIQLVCTFTELLYTGDTLAVIPTAAPQRRRPCSSLAAKRILICFSISLMVISRAGLRIIIYNG